MDRLRDDVFIQIFTRFTQWIALRGTESPRDINERINRVLRLMRQGIRTAKRDRTVRKWRNNYVQLRKLKRHGIADRIAKEARKNPSSIYALSMKYGYSWGIRIRMAQQRKRVDSGRVPRRKRKTPKSFTRRYPPRRRR